MASSPFFGESYVNSFQIVKDDQRNCSEARPLYGRGSFFCLPYKKEARARPNELAKPAKRTSQAIFGDTKERTVAKRNRS